MTKGNISSVKYFKIYSILSQWRIHEVSFSSSVTDQISGQKLALHHSAIKRRIFLFCPKVLDFELYKIEKRLQIVTFEKLELDNVWPFFPQFSQLINEWTTKMEMV